MNRHIIALLSVVVILTLSCSDQKSSAQPPNQTSGKTEWIDIAKLQPGPIQHENLSERQLERIRTIQASFAEVDPTSIEEWVDNFKRDMNPDRELAVWEHVAYAYSSSSCLAVRSGSKGAASADVQGDKWLGNLGSGHGRIHL